MARRQTQQAGLVPRPALYPQVTYAGLQAQAEARHLTILGGFHPDPDDQALSGCQTLLMLGPDEPGFWPAFTTSKEWQDGTADPMDRWSIQVISAWATQLDAVPLFPFGGPPYLPFFSWALRTGRIRASPVMLLVHDTAGLFVSFRGALALSDHIELPPAPESPCETCATQPCRRACPVNALNGTSYDVPTCKEYLGTDAGQSCMSSGCAARGICPVSQCHPRLPAQSAYHMTTFKG